MNNLVQNKQSVNKTWLVYAILQKKKKKSKPPTKTLTWKPISGFCICQELGITSIENDVFEASYLH